MKQIIQVLTITISPIFERRLHITSIAFTRIDSYWKYVTEKNSFCTVQHSYFAKLQNIYEVKHLLFSGELVQYEQRLPAN